MRQWLKIFGTNRFAGTSQRSDKVSAFVLTRKGRIRNEPLSTLSKAIQEYKRQDNATDEIAAVKHVGKKVFTLLDGRWVDNAFKKDMKTTTVKFGSEEYFKLLNEKPDLKDFLALGQRVTVVLEDGTALVVVE
jgi:uncharacterized Fe-S cluster-containing protein